MPEKYTGDKAEHVEIEIPDLKKEKYLQSNHTTPEESVS